jgi:selenocysteine lyase/cysteine desulfurase
MNRRAFIAGGAGLMAVAASAEWAGTRNNFPRALNETYFNSASQHPLGLHAVRAMQRYMDFMSRGPGAGRADFWDEGFTQVKPMFAKFINADPSEIALCPSTTVGENIILNGMDLRRGNVVTNDLHYTSSISDYISRREAYGLDVRIVKHSDWHMDLGEMEKAVDKNTRLVAVSLVSSINGHLEDVRTLSGLAHAHGALLYADIVQACGAIPIDVKAMGIDLASCAMYKWLMGEHGFGFLYVRKDLIETVVKGTQFEGSPSYNYLPWVRKPDLEQPEIANRGNTGVNAFQCGTPSAITYAAQYESFRYIERLGVANIQAHARPIVARLRKELSALGYAPITAKDTETPIITFLCPDIEATKAKFRKARLNGRVRVSTAGENPALTLGRFGNHMRFSVSVFNNQDDVNRILEVLS